MKSWSLLKKSGLLIFFGIVFSCLSFVPWYAFLPSCLYWESRPYVTNGSHLNQDLGFFVDGSYVKLDVYVNGGDSQISAQVLNAGFDNITKEVAIEGSGFIAFAIPTRDYYSLNLRNTFYYYQNDKQVLVKVYYYFYNPIFLISGLVILVCGVALILNYELKSIIRNRQ